MSRRGGATQAGAVIRRRRRAVLEFLEDRTLLSSAPQTYVVANLNDSGAGSLREAISNANADTYSGSTYDTIQFDSSLAGKTIDLTTAGDSTVGDSALAITAPVQIVGEAAPGLTIERSSATGTPNFRIFYVSRAGNLTLQNLTVSGGKSTYGSGGGIYNDSGTLTLTNDTLSGNSANVNYGDACGGGIYNGGGTLTLTNDTLSGNSALSFYDFAYGGGIYNGGGTVTLTNDIFSGNSAYVVSGDGIAAYGGGIDNGGGTVTLTNDILSGNSANGYYGGGGGGIFNGSGMMTLTNDTLSGNTAISFSAGYGGGIDNVGGTVTLTNDTLSGNSAYGYYGGYGGGIDNVGGTVTLTNDTLSGNSTGNGGGIYNESGTVNLGNTIIAGNTTSYPDRDVDGRFTSEGHNLIGNTQDSAGWVVTDLTGTVASPLDPMLSALASNGGPTQTMALMAGSPAIDAGSATINGAPTTDQRGALRGALGLNAGANPDIGAYEASSSLPGDLDHRLDRRRRPPRRS